jgi:cell filamentation protein, protein adenylyltransferase
MYESQPDPYCYPGTDVLKNRLGLRDGKALAAFEAEITAQRAAEPLPAGRLSYAQYRAIHKHLFQDVYSWAGKLRTIRISKGRNTFCYPEHVDREMRRLFAELARRRHLRGLSADAFAAAAAHFLAELNAIHPFREGNGRTQLSFLTLLAEQAGHPLNLDRLDPSKILDAIIKSFGGDEAPLRVMLQRLVE